ncbi:hypothetical protein Ahu01nite_049770 [Winogradskya humida]|uniref:Uncharacterized protein n=1 Tax=Winogradskya humida TaxID=113566 RepID=A0ABQ3ZTE1_9ACTN|nr:hypothetical protein Ahu01nite_049770 [Actinoplanes humidus]
MGNTMRYRVAVSGARQHRGTRFDPVQPGVAGRAEPDRFALRFQALLGRDHGFNGPRRRNALRPRSSGAARFCVNSVQDDGGGDPVVGDLARGQGPGAAAG